MAEKKSLRLKRHLSVIAHGPDVVELRHGVWNPTSFTLSDESESGVLFRLLSKLDGTASPAELAAAEGIDEADVEAVLDHLLEMGAVESGPGHALDHYLDTAVPLLRAKEGEESATEGAVLLGDGDLTGEIRRYLERSLPQAELSAAADDETAMEALSSRDTSWLMNAAEFQQRLAAFEAWRGKLLIVATKVINPVRLRAVNRVCLELRVPWIHAAVDGPFLFVGPVFVPHRTACYECFETRVAMNLREVASYQKYKRAIVAGQIKTGSIPLEPVLAGILGSLTAFESLNFLLTETTFCVGKVLAVYLPTMEITFNEVLRVASCSACGSVAERDEGQLYFDARAFLGDEV